MSTFWHSGLARASPKRERPIDDAAIVDDIPVPDPPICREVQLWHVDGKKSVNIDQRVSGIFANTDVDSPTAAENIHPPSRKNDTVPKSDTAVPLVRQHQGKQGPESWVADSEITQDSSPCTMPSSTVRTMGFASGRPPGPVSGHHTHVVRVLPEISLRRCTSTNPFWEQVNELKQQPLLDGETVPTGALRCLGDAVHASTEAETPLTDADITMVPIQSWEQKLDWRSFLSEAVAASKAREMFTAFDVEAEPPPFRRPLPSSCQLRPSGGECRPFGKSKTGL